MLVQLNSKTAIYRGFTILKLPRKNRIRASVTKSPKMVIIWGWTSDCLRLDRLSISYIGGINDNFNSSSYGSAKPFEC
jgi:hypothetical protein